MKKSEMTIAVNNLTRKKVPPIALWLDNFLVFSQKYLPREKFFQGEISVAVVGGRRMAKINEEYRKKEGSTDVLSFVYEKRKNYLEGELIFCPEAIDQRARQNGLSLEEEWQRDFVHGMLHLWGWEHSEEMFLWQEKVFQFLQKKKR